MANNYKAVKDFLCHHYRHFNAATVIEAAEAWRQQLAQGNRMLVTLAGAMSTAELGILLAEMIRQEKVHAICCTGANLEEDLFNLVAHDHYRRIPNWRALSAEEEWKLAEQGLNRVTDTCIPEEEAMRRIEATMLRRWTSAGSEGRRFLPHEFFYEVLRSGELAGSYQIDPRNSWLNEAAARDLPIFVPGWEDSTLGNMFVAATVRGEVGLDVVKGGLHYMHRLIHWYQETTRDRGLGFFQIGGGIAGDFPICVVPLIAQDLEQEVRLWSYFCQISDSTTSYGSYSGAVPNEKITWGKLDIPSPKFIIESDATIVAPLIFSYLLAE
ncbi:MAG TPA: deoxyhypusine synthase family protein [Thermoanaerobaculia bacterium]|nr:deoxyhypusine synthase family protein [Thermoanaerobaculia bacterium]